MLVFEGKSGPGKGRHIVLLAGDEEYRSEEGLPQLAKILSQRHGFKCTVLFSLNGKGEIDPRSPGQPTWHGGGEVRRSLHHVASISTVAGFADAALC